MYETEANTNVETGSRLPWEVISSFAGLRGGILARTVLPWSEHCTECVWPSCYSTCDLYTPREDGRCRRFVDGMVRIDAPTVFNQYLLRIRFKRWGKLWTPGNVRLRSIVHAQRIERRDYYIGRTLQQFPLPAPIKTVAIEKRYGLKKRLALLANHASEVPSSFLVECFNPSKQTITLSLTIASFDKAEAIPFQKLMSLDPGFHTYRVPYQDIAAVIDLRSPFHIDLIPNENGHEITLYFGLMEFVKEVRGASETSKIKCVVWDLDNTLWEGILVEDGPEKIRLRPDIHVIIKELDRRGILQSIASKNSHEDAMRALKQFGLEEYFLCPKISWEPKGKSIFDIAGQLNIGLDTVLFVDDSEFELQQVRRSCPGVRVLHAKDCGSIPHLPECQVPVTTESTGRRRMYQVERIRKETAQCFQQDYRAFLRHCEIQLMIQPLSEENLERVHELTQRTNQMNFSGNRYDREVLKTILQTSFLDTFVLSCEDRFGSYGTIGFGIVDNREPRLTDLMFSCRVQSKRVEHAFLGFVLRKYIALTRRDFCADYRKTTHNRSSGQVFTDMGMEEAEIRDEVTKLVFRKNKQIPDDDIIRIAVSENPLK